MGSSDDAKRRAVSAVAAVRDDIHRVITFGTTGYDVFGQPRFHPDEMPEIPWVTRWREARAQKAVEMPRGDVSTPGE